MASANDGDRATAGILHLLLGMAAAPSALARVGGGGVLLVQQVIIDGYVLLGGEREQPEREEPWTIRIEDVD
jgi:hypothetical protein